MNELNDNVGRMILWFEFASCDGNVIILRSSVTKPFFCFIWAFSFYFYKKIFIYVIIQVHIVLLIQRYLYSYYKVWLHYDIKNILFMYKLYYIAELVNTILVNLTIICDLLFALLVLNINYLIKLFDWTC